jgi:hypothetical protein
LPEKYSGYAPHAENRNVFLLSNVWKHLCWVSTVEGCGLEQKSVACNTFKKTIEAVSSDVPKAFLKYPWPGNVREIEHTMEHAFVLCSHLTPCALTKSLPFRKVLPGIEVLHVTWSNATLLLHATVPRSKSTGFDGHILP